MRPKNQPGKVHTTVVRPTVMYGAVKLVVMKVQEKAEEKVQQKDMGEMTMLRCIFEATKLVIIRKEIIRGTTKVAFNKTPMSLIRFTIHDMRNAITKLGTN